MHEIYKCFKCGEPLEINSLRKVGRGEECPRCKADLHVCLNCKHYDLNAYNLCREPQAERVLDKDKRNFCDYFSFKTGSEGLKAGPERTVDYLKSLDELFKK